MYTGSEHAALLQIGPVLSCLLKIGPVTGILRVMEDTATTQPAMRSTLWHEVSDETLVNSVM